MYNGLEIIGGEFIRAGKVVKPEFGNREQIECLKKHEARLKEIEEEGSVANYNYNTSIHAHIWFKCGCGKTLEEDFEVDEEDLGDVLGHTMRCYKCNITYELDEDEQGQLIFKKDNP
ncbi:MAG: hypothetical protein ACXACY_19195 [Candidatus Hodarchaeales archaeon]|jgi:hypothetical protein